MFEATYLGNQGWLFSSEGAVVVVDPIFGSEFGRGPVGARYRCHPPRRWNVDEFPPIDALVMTHEHEDHLNIPSLARVDRHVPVFLSSRASRAAHTIVRELGFTVTRLDAGARVAFGDLALRTFTPNHVDIDEVDEWDTLAFAISDAPGHGAFFTNVDIHITAEMVDHVRREREARRASPGNAGGTLVFYGGSLAEVEALVATDRDGEEKPEYLLDPDRALASLAAGATFWPVAGLTFRMERGQTIRVTEAPFVRTPPMSSWPPPEAAGLIDAPHADYLPVCGRPTFDDADLPRLASVLDALASFLYGRTLFRRLHSLSIETLAGRKPTFILLLRTDDQAGSYAAEYDASACAFRFVEGDALRLEDYVGGFECWANDLLALAEGTFEPRIVSGGHARRWSASPAILRFDFEREALWPFFHPLHRPEACLRRCREVAREEQGARVQVRRRG